MTLFCDLTNLNSVFSSATRPTPQIALSLGLLSIGTWAAPSLLPNSSALFGADTKANAAPLGKVRLGSINLAELQEVRTDKSALARTLDGSGNNLLNPTLGSLGQSLDRKGNANYGDGLSSIADGPNPRAISNAVFSQPDSILNQRGLSDFNWAWGQFLSHDISHTLAPHDEFAMVPVPAGDLSFIPGQAIPMTRSLYDETTGITTPRQQINNITPWIDGGNVYGGRANEIGSGIDRADWLRTGSDGKLEVSVIDGLSYLPVASQKAGAPEMDGGAVGIDEEKMFVAGDVRANENAVLTSLHTLMVREHNRVVDEIADNYGPYLSTLDADQKDEFLYQSAKKVVGAQIQAVTFNEYLPALGIALDDYAGYDDTVDPSVMNEFSTAAFRLGHSQISGQIKRVNPDGTTHEAGDLNLFEGFFDPDAFAATDIDSIFRGLASNIQQETDVKITDDLRNLSFGPPAAGPIMNGTDLASLNILRSRDHGLGTYNDTRAAYGLEAFENFADITSDITTQQALASVYDSVDEIDLWVGMLVEDHLDNASVGELIQAAWADQFGRLRASDRFWYANDAAFLEGGLLSKAGFNQYYFDKLTLAQIISNNTGIDADTLGHTGNAFFVFNYKTAKTVPEPMGVFSAILLAGTFATRKR
ncbi:MAG: peroxidase family protein [Cyanobacteria bacterium P01_F01_bin.53]